jgi:Rrf2 family protein
MDLSLSLRGDYVVRAALALARRWERDGYCKIREVTEEMALPSSYAPQILGLLAKAGLAEARAGRDGGYRLSRSPKDISMLDVVEAGEGQLTLGRCTLRGGPCRWHDVCAVHPFLFGANDDWMQSIRKRTLADVVGSDRALESRARNRKKVGARGAQERTGGTP